MEETLSCAVFEEDSLSRKLNCEYFAVIVSVALFWVAVFSLRVDGCVRL